MEKFIDREMEMDTLQREYERNGSALVILYGRRRVGKTTLISEFIKDKNALFFLAVRNPKRRTVWLLRIRPRSLSIVTCCGLLR